MSIVGTDMEVNVRLDEEAELCCHPLRSRSYDTRQPCLCRQRGILCRLYVCIGSALVERILFNGFRA
jgi:hypothetical protein